MKPESSVVVCSQVWSQCSSYITDWWIFPLWSRWEGSLCFQVQWLKGFMCFCFPAWHRNNKTSLNLFPLHVPQLVLWMAAQQVSSGTSLFRLARESHRWDTKERSETVRGTLLRGQHTATQENTLRYTKHVEMEKTAESNTCSTAKYFRASIWLCCEYLDVSWIFGCAVNISLCCEYSVVLWISGDVVSIW